MHKIFLVANAKLKLDWVTDKALRYQDQRSIQNQNLWNSELYKMQQNYLIKTNTLQTKKENHTIMLYEHRMCRFSVFKWQANDLVCEQCL